jgi:hypothetical protein
MCTGLTGQVVSITGQVVSITGQVVSIKEQVVSIKVSITGQVVSIKEHRPHRAGFCFGLLCRHHRHAGMHASRETLTCMLLKFAQSRHFASHLLLLPTLQAAAESAKQQAAKLDNGEGADGEEEEEEAVEGAVEDEQAEVKDGKAGGTSQLHLSQGEDEEEVEEGKGGDGDEEDEAVKGPKTTSAAAAAGG